MPSTVKEKLLQIQQEIAPSQPRIIAITKYFDENRLIEAYEAGLRDFGENRVQDALEKFAKLPKEIIEDSTFHLAVLKIYSMHQQLCFRQSPLIRHCTPR